MNDSIIDTEKKHTFIHYYSQAMLEIEEFKYKKALDKLYFIDTNIINNLNLKQDKFYQDFDNVIDFIAASIRSPAKNKSGYEIVWVDIPVSKLYKYLAYCFTELKEFDKAVSALYELLEWNKLSSHAFYELSFLQQWIYKDHKKAFDYGVEGLRNSYTNEDRAIGYRHIGASLVDLNMLEYSLAAYIKSLSLDQKNSIALKQIKYIESKNNNLTRNSMSLKRSEYLLSSINIPISIDPIFIEAKKQFQKMK